MYWQETYLLNQVASYEEKPRREQSLKQVAIVVAIDCEQLESIETMLRLSSHQMIEIKVATIVVYVQTEVKPIR